MPFQKGASGPVVLATELGSPVRAVMLFSTEPASSPALLSCIYAARVQAEKHKSEVRNRRRLTSSHWLQHCQAFPRLSVSSRTGPQDRQTEPTALPRCVLDLARAAFCRPKSLHQRHLHPTLKAAPLIKSVPEVASETLPCTE